MLQIIKNIGSETKACMNMRIKNIHRELDKAIIPSFNYRMSELTAIYNLIKKKKILNLKKINPKKTLKN